MADSERFICDECGWRGDIADVLKAPNPFEPAAEVMGCPDCKSVDSMLLVCDEPGCWRETSCGTPTPDGGYRRTCGEHMPRRAEGTTHG